MKIQHWCGPAFFSRHESQSAHKDTYPERFVKLGGVDILGIAAHATWAAGAAVHAGKVLEGVAAEEHGGGVGTKRVVRKRKNEAHTQMQG